MVDILTPERLAEIAALAKKATPGPWAARARPGWRSWDVAEYGSTGICLPQVRRENAEYVAAVDPQTVLALLASHAALQAEVERLRGQLLVCREAGKMLSGALTSSEDQREATLDRIWDSINAHGGTFEADDLEGKGKCEMIDKALAIIEKEGGVGELQRLSLKTKEEADDE